MRLTTKKDAAFSIRMTPMERGDLDAIADKYDRPRSWVIRKLVKLFAALERAREEKTLTEEERATLSVLKNGMKEPVEPADTEED